MARTQRRGMPNDTDALLGALAVEIMDLHFTATAMARSITEALNTTASAEERRTLSDRARSLKQVTSRLQAAIHGRTDHPHDGRQIRLKMA